MKTDAAGNPLPSELIPDPVVRRRGAPSSILPRTVRLLEDVARELARARACSSPKDLLGAALNLSFFADCIATETMAR